MTLTKADIVDELLNDLELGLERHEARHLVDDLFEVIRAELAKGEKVKISGFGNFDVRKKNARPGRNPRTGEEVEISPRCVVTFKAGQLLKQFLANELTEQQFTQQLEQDFRTDS